MRRVSYLWKIFLYSFFVTIFLFTSSCEKEELSNIQLVNREIYRLMKDIYLWYDQVPALDPDVYVDPNAYIRDLRYDALDKWSFVMSYEEFNDYFDKGEIAGHGISLGVDEENNVRIVFVYRNTAAYNAGLRRGWIVKKVNDVPVTPENIFTLIGESSPGITNKFEFANRSYEAETIELTKEVLTIDPFLYEEVITLEDKKIGYMVFQDFIEPAIDAIDEVMSNFAAQNVTEIIIDLRYNGGGLLDVASHFSGWVASNNAGEVLLNYIHNDKYTGMNKSEIIPVVDNGLNFDRIIFLTTSSSASASELLINGLKPYADVELIGQHTHGKPVGMYAIGYRSYGYVVNPVSFKFTNKNDEGEFYEGLSVNFELNDDLTHDFGDREEALLKAALDYIKSGSVQPLIKSTKKSNILLPAGNLNEYQRAF